MVKPVIALSIPTGIGADIGGYAGDFGYIARKFSKYFHCIVNPNAVNGGILSAINNDMSYLEGYLFDEFFRGNIGLLPLKPYETNNIGVIFDCAIPQNIINVHINTINALKVVQGIKISGIEYTKNPVGVNIEIENGISSGSLDNPDELLLCTEKLIKAGADAIAVICYFNEDSEDENYANGSGIDPVGGIEAVISHIITKKYLIPSAHSPAFFDVDISEKIENPKVASELISSTYLPCIMQGLSIAPKIIKKTDSQFNNSLTYQNVEYLIVPYDALGSGAVLSSIENNVKIITVENKTVLNVSAKKLNFEPYEHFRSYEECLQNLTKRIKKK